MNERVREKLERLPRAPGVYVMRAQGGAVLYVGKAADLRSRVRSYFAPGAGDPRFFVARLDEELDDLETIVTANDREAFLLENSLIKELHPRYNVRLRDDKDYLSVRLDEKADWPRLELVRRPKPDGARYFGPFSSARVARQAVRIVQRLFRIRPCRDSVFRGRSRPCLVYQLGRCDGPCVLPVDREAYRTSVRRAVALLDGRRDAVLDDLRREMAGAAAVTQYERAAELRDQIAAVERASWDQVQDVVEVSRVDRDVVGLYRDGPVTAVVVLEIRSGRVVGARPFAFAGVEVPDAELLAEFLGRRYAGGAPAPDEVLLPLEIPDPQMLEAFLTEARGRKVRVRVPRRGRLRRLLALARANAEQRFREESRDRESAAAQAEAWAKALGLRRPPHTVECVDISHWGAHAEQGATVGAIAAWRDGRMDKARYRHFRLRGDHAGDDYAAMREVLLRRFERARGGEPRWAPPDVLVVDGGRGQLAVAAAVIHDLGIQGTALAAIAKPQDASHDGDQPPLSAGPNRVLQGAAPEEWQPRAEARGSEGGTRPAGSEAVQAKLDTVYVAGRSNPLKLRAGSAALHLLARLRDETHRFAVTYQGKVRGRRRLSDRLSGIPGVGPVTRRKLLRAFGSVARLAAAGLAEIAAVEGVTGGQARTITLYFAANRDGESGPPPGDRRPPD
ncbi:MAG: excinuclease ABC subunit UvrC [Deltaproteobacteria bacterium]|nr:excinuclease ABC subunit UvrC [Deltaproteobacteria bacterium]